MKHVRAAIAAAGTAALTAALVFGGAGAAQAYPAAVGEVDAVVFNNGSVVDLTNEYLNLSADLGTFGLASITPFDGGDGSAATWTAALTGAELLVLPEQEFANFYDAGGKPWVSDAGLAVIKTWVEAGNFLLLAGSQSYIDEGDSGDEYFGQAPLFSALTCLAITNDELYTFDEDDEFTPAVALTGAPDPLPWRDGTYAFVSDVWSAPLTSIATPIYTGETTIGGGQVLNTVGAATFGIGNGAVIYLAYDWFEDTSDEWYNVLQLAVSGAFPYAPQPVCGQLAATGAEVPAAPIAAGAGILLLAGVLALVAVRRRTA
jgi:hypothetical protein